MLKIYNSLGRLREAQRLTLPTNCEVHLCENFLIFFSSREVTLIQIGGSILGLSAKNPGIDNVTNLAYNPRTNQIILVAR